MIQLKKVILFAESYVNDILTRILKLHFHLQFPRNEKNFKNILHMYTMANTKKQHHRRKMSN